MNCLPSSIHVASVQRLAYTLANDDGEYEAHLECPAKEDIHDNQHGRETDGDLDHVQHTMRQSVPQHGMVDYLMHQ